jgi:hypothetical protein
VPWRAGQQRGEDLRDLLCGESYVHYTADEVRFRGKLT